VPDQRFFFALKLSDHSRFDAMLGDVAECVLKQLGYTTPVVADFLVTLREALAQGGAPGSLECDVRFLAEDGQLHMVVSSEGGREWRVSRALPD
jgi:hypothetical protein